MRHQRDTMTHTYAHMCRDGHVQIGHNDSEYEMCQLCRTRTLLQRVMDTWEDNKPIGPKLIMAIYEEVGDD
jgi:hypothetical protein